MGGTIVVESEIGKGSMFTVTIPLTIKENPQISHETPLQDTRMKMQFQIQHKYLSLMSHVETSVTERESSELTAGSEIIIAEGL